MRRMYIRLRAPAKIGPDTNSHKLVLLAGRPCPQRWLAVRTMPQDRIGCRNQRKLKALIPRQMIGRQQREGFCCLFYCFTVLHLPQKSDAKLSQEINAHLPIYLMSMSLVLRLPRDMHLSRHLIVRKCPVHQFPTLDFANVLRHSSMHFSTSQLSNMLACWCILYMFTSTCASCHNSVHFSTSQLPKVLQTWCALHMLTWKCASRHKGVTCFISPVARWLRAHCFRAYFSTH